MSRFEVVPTTATHSDRRNTLLQLQNGTAKNPFGICSQPDSYPRADCDSNWETLCSKSRPPLVWVPLVEALDDLLEGTRLRE